MGLVEDTLETHRRVQRLIKAIETRSIPVRDESEEVWCQQLVAIYDRDRHIIRWELDFGKREITWFEDWDREWKQRGET